MTDRIAVIDIGSNSVRYMVAELQNGRACSRGKELITTRLAEGQNENRELQEEPMRRTIEAVLCFVDRAKKDGTPVYAYATSALREASNRAAFTDRIHDVVPLAILSGEDEGKMAYFGATGGKGTLLDIGGGSFQIVTDRNAFSAPIGCVRFRDRMAQGSPEELAASATPWIASYLPENLSVEAPVTGVGGTITTLGALLLGQTRYDGAALKEASITPDNLLDLLDRLYAMGESRKDHPLLKNRHNVILQGGTILYCLMERFSIDAVTPCDRDGMEGFAEAVIGRKILVK